jgi:hypothetical protein
MEQEIIIDALGKHLSSFQYILAWAVIVAFGVGWAGLQNSKELEVVSLKFNRRAAFYVATLLYLMANLATLLLLWRMEALLSSLDDQHFLRGYTTLALHEWLLNPFAYAGSSAIASLSTIWSIGLLIISWWICITSVVVLRGKQPILKSVILPILFYAAGIVSLVSFYRIYQINLQRLLTIHPTLHAGLKQTAPARWAAIWIGTIAGMGILIVALRSQRRGGRKPAA